MKFFTFKTLAISLVTAVGTLTTHAAGFEIDGNSLLSRQLRTEHHGRKFRGQKPFTVNDAMSSTIGQRQLPNKVATKDPTLSFTSLPQYDYMEGPDGSTWFYTAEYKIETIEHNPLWTEEVLKAFTFTIYDSSFNEVGKISDEIRLAENETRAREVVLDPAVSAKFFNTDDRYEVMVFFVMNTPQYVNHYYYKVYSIGGEKDNDGNDVGIATIEGRCVDATNVGSADEENFYYTFVTDPVIEYDASYGSYVDYLNTLTYDLRTYKKATAEEGPSLIFTKGIYGTRIPGDTTDGIYLITKPLNGALYLIYSQYEKPYFIDPTGGATDESATPDNSLLIEVYSTTGNTPEKLSTTNIPVENITVDNALIYSFYSIGNVAWTDDVDMTVNGTPSAPAFVVTRSFANAATMEDITSSYDIYANNGQWLKNLAVDTEHIIVFDAVDGKQPQIMFIQPDENTGYQFTFANLYTAETLFAISQQNDGDPLTASCARAKMLDGSYQYAFEMSHYEEGEDGNEYARVAWFDTTGKLTHIDKINMGTNVQYATVNLTSEVLNPHLYDADDAMEYAILVKRTHGNAARNEFVVVDDNGNTFASFTADDGKGDPYIYTVLLGNPNRLMMVYNANGRFNVDLYDLPFLTSVPSGIEHLNHAGAAGSLHYDGATIAADNATIEVYNSTGAKTAQGRNSVSTENLPSGIYIIVATDANGNKTTAKILH